LEPSARSFTLFKEELALGYDKGTDVMLMTNEKIKYLVASMRHNQAENGEQPSVSGRGGAQAATIGATTRSPAFGCVGSAGEQRCSSREE